VRRIDSDLFACDGASRCRTLRSQASYEDAAPGCFTLCPVPGMAQMAGTWEGSLKFPARLLRIVLHISGEDNDLKATGDSPDQGNRGGKVDSITFSGRSLNFSIPPLDVRFNGDLMSDGTIVGTFTLHGTGLPLVLTRSPGVPRQSPDVSSGMTDGRYHNDRTGIDSTT